MNKLKILRDRNNLTQLYVSMQSGVHIDTIRNWENGINNIRNANVSNVKADADVFGVSIEELIIDDE